MHPHVSVCVYMCVTQTIRVVIVSKFNSNVLRGLFITDLIDFPLTFLPWRISTLKSLEEDLQTDMQKAT